MFPVFVDRIHDTLNIHLELFSKVQMNIKLATSLFVKMSENYLELIMKKNLTKVKACLPSINFFLASPRLLIMLSGLLRNISPNIFSVPFTAFYKRELNLTFMHLRGMD